MTAIPKFSASSSLAVSHPDSSAHTDMPASPSHGTRGKRKRADSEHDSDSDSPPRKLNHPPSSAIQTQLVRAAKAQPSSQESAMLLASHPERITTKLVNDAEFRQAYVAFIDQLTSLNNGSIDIHDPEALRRASEGALKNREQHQDAWEKTIYASALSRLTGVQNPALTVSAKATDDSLQELVLAMKEAPEKPIFWMINGNNHFHTHQGLKPILKAVAETRSALKGKGADKDVVLISGNAAGITPFSAGPIVKYTGPDGEFVGPAESTEAAAIESLLKMEPTVAGHFHFEQETKARNTRENILNTNRKLKGQDKELKNFITVNSQSGFSGLRSALTMLGVTSDENFPAKIYLINPDIKPEESIAALSYEATGKMFIQAMREFMNLTADISRSFFIPPVPLPHGIIDSFTTCLRKIGIDPDAVHSHDVHQLLRKMHETAMLPNEEKLVDPRKGYASAITSYAQASEDLRVKQDALETLRDRWDNEVNAASLRQRIKDRQP
jgi:hypothetical protein